MEQLREDMPCLRCGKRLRPVQAGAMPLGAGVRAYVCLSCGKVELYSPRPEELCPPEDLPQGEAPQRICPYCGNTHDVNDLFCPYCEYDYRKAPQ